MVKFSKELEAQLIPEWKDAFVNYSHLKKKVKKIKVRRGSRSEEQPDFGVSLFDSFRFIWRKISSAFRDQKAEKREIIKVRERGEEDEEALYETELVEVASDQEDEIKDFFERLNGELEKVNQFYKTKEREFLERADILKKQLQTLVDLKQVLDDQRKKSYSLKSTRLSTLPSFNFSSVGGCGHPAAMESQAVPEGPAGSNSSMEGGTAAVAPTKGRTRIDIPATTPGQTISAVTSTLWKDVVGSPKKDHCKGEHVNRKRLQCAEKMIRGAFVELYKGLGLLKTYRKSCIHKQFLLVSLPKTAR